MAISNISLHTRSISLPSSSHPLDVDIEDNLRRLRAPQASLSASSSVCQYLCSIKDLYEHMDVLICLPHNQKSLRNGNIEEILEGSLALLDASSSAMDAMSQMKDSILDLQSSLRRGNAIEGIRACLVSRKKINKMVSKCLADMKKANKNSACLETDAIAMRMLKEAEAICLSMLKSVFSLVMGKKVLSQTCNWSIVAKLVKAKRGSSELEEASEIEEVDSILLSVHKKQLGAETKVLLKQLERLEMVIHELEDGLESVSRCLVKTRVSLLNVLNHY